ncbi:MAG TPA: efflux RND transporter periplasmic adaptor subunit [Ktedonobacteraceae bacterium]|nr:efflux RND transporter periplasmic adaptor subunit [Ktedonobacteraceae bacterium]
MRRIIFIPVLIVVAILAIAGGVLYYLYQGYLYYGTDDAQVTGNILSVSAPAAGQLTTLDVKLGDRVNRGDKIATITTVSSTTGAKNTVDVTSPMSGVVIQDAAIEGQSVAPGFSLVQVTDLSNLTVTAYVDEGAINDIQVGQTVDVTVDAYSGTSFTGKVQQIVNATAGTFSLLPTQDNASGNFTKVGQRIPVVITLDSTSGKHIVPGMNTSVKIHIH